MRDRTVHKSSTIYFNLSEREERSANQIVILLDGAICIYAHEMQKSAHEMQKSAMQGVPGFICRRIANLQSVCKMSGKSVSLIPPLRNKELEGQNLVQFLYYYCTTNQPMSV